MRASRCIGRVGGLAVALGVGAGVVLGSSGVASADPSADPSGDSSADSSVKAENTARSPRESVRTRSSAPRKSAASRAPRNNAPAPSSAVRANDPIPSVTNPPDRAPLPAQVHDAPAASASAVTLPTAAPAPIAVQAVAPRVVTAAAIGTVTPVPSPFSASGTGSPAEATAAWAVLAAVRRFGRHSSIPAPSATLFTGQTFTPRASATRTSRFQWKFRNATPTLAPQQTGQSARGVVTGTVGAYDADGDPLTFSVVSNPAHGTVQIDSRGVFTYTPDATSAHNGVTDQFTVTTSDAGAGRHRHGPGSGSGGHTATSTVTVVVSPVNEAPTGTASVGTPNLVTGVVAGVINGSDADGDPLSYTGSTTTSKGTAVVAPDGSFTYAPTAGARQTAAQPNAGETDTTDTFTVTITDGHGGSTPVAVQVPISPNAAPVASASAGSPNPNTGVVAGVVGATDPDGDPLTYSVSTAAGKGTASVAANGTFTYTPNSTARHAAAKLTAPAGDKIDGFTITVSDGRGGTTAVPVSVTVDPANVAPTGTPSVGVPDATTGLLAGAVLGADLDGDTLAFSAPSSTAKGTITIAPDGTFTYTPTALARHVAGLAGAGPSATTDTFTVTITDGYGGSTAVPVLVAVSPASVTFNFVYSGSGWTAASKAAMETAAARLSSYLVVNAPVTITYTAVGQNQPNSGFLASNYTEFSSASAGFYGTVVQTEILTGVDANGSNADSQISWNFAYPWAFGDTVTNSQYDFQAVAMHELFHSLGMLTAVSPTNLSNTNWTTYDRWLSTADGTKVIGGDYLFNPLYTANLTGGNGGLYFDGPNAVAAYGGPVPIYDPSTWTSGSSVSHLDPAYAPAGTIYLMDPSDGYGIGVRTLTAVEIGILKDLGYTVYQSGSFVFVFGFGLLRRRRR